MLILAFQTMIALAMAASYFSGSVSPRNELQLPADLPGQEWDQEDADADRLKNTERFLRRLDLVDLEVRLLEKRLETNSDDRASSEVVAKRLVTHYANRMTNPSVSSIHWVGKTKALLINFPSLNNPSIRIAMAQANYIDSEKKFQRWRAKGSASEELPPLNREWQSLGGDLNRVLEDLQTEYQDQLTILQASGGRAREVSSQLSQSESDIAQTEYLLAWTSYFIGVLNPQSRKQNHTQADRYFRQFLDIDPEIVLLELTPKWIDFQSSYQTRALAGLAMCQRGLDHPDQSDHCFQLLNNSLRIDNDIDSIHRWRLNSQLFVNDLVGLNEIMSAMINDDRVSQPGRAKFWIDAWRGAMAIESQTPLVAKQLRDAAAAGLARDFQAQAIRDLLKEESNGLELLEPTFLQNWLRGYLDFDSLASDLPKEAYQARLAVAKTQLLKSIEQGSRSQDQPKAMMRDLDRLMVRFLVAQIELAEKKLNSPIEELLRLSKSFETIDGLNETRRKHFAANAQWLAIGALTQRSQSPNERTTMAVRAIREIDHLVHRFPNCKFVRKAEFLRIKLINQNGSHVDAIARLAKIPQDDPNAVDAQLEIIRHRHEQWRESLLAKGANEPQHWSEFLASLQLLEQLDSASDKDRLTGRIRFVSASIDRGRTDQASLQALLTETEEALRTEFENQDSSASLVEIANELKFNQFRFAMMTENKIRVHEILVWLEQNANQSIYHRAAVIEMAQLLDQHMRKLESQTEETQFPTTELAQKRAEAIEIFSQLVKLLGDSDESLTANSNARVAFSRLAQWKLESGETTIAREMAQRLVKLFDRRKDFRLLLARSFMATKMHEEAIPHLHLLSAAATPGTDEWYESKLNLIDCMIHSGDAKSAQQLLKQTRLLSPNLPERWQARLNALEQ